MALNIVLERKRTGTYLLLFTIIAVIAMASIYCLMVLKMQYAWFGIAAFAVAFLGMCLSASEIKAMVVINEVGIYDARLGIGTISWEDIEDVQISGGYGNRFLCFRVRNPDLYLARLSGVRREKALFHHTLGFQRFNVDLSDLEGSLLDLKKQIDLRISRHQVG